MTLHPVALPHQPDNEVGGYGAPYARRGGPTNHTANFGAIQAVLS